MFTSLICPVLGSSLPILLSPMRQNQTLPALSSAMPYGPPDDGYSLMAPVFVSRLATLLPLCMVNQIVPRAEWRANEAIKRAPPRYAKAVSS